jgi:hypothetical protein
MRSFVSVNSATQTLILDRAAGLRRIKPCGVPLELRIKDKQTVNMPHGSAARWQSRAVN